MASSLFWMIVVAMAALAVSVVLRPLWAVTADRQPVADPGQIYRAQLDEISRDQERGTTTPEEAQRLRAEVARRLLEIDRRPDVGGARPALSRPAMLMAGGLVIATGLGAVALYSWLGRPDMPDMALANRLAASDAAYAARPSQAVAEAAAPAPPAITDPQFSSLLDQLRKVMKDRPDDLQGLTFLAEYEARAGNFAAAARAQEHVIAVKGPEQASAEDHAMLAQYQIFAATEIVTPEAEAALSQALAIDPSNPRATYFLGLMFAQLGRPDKTLPLWQGLLMTEPDSAPWIEPIRASIMDIAAAAGERFEMPGLKGPSAAEAEAAAGMAADDRAAMISGMVKGLEERLFTSGGSMAEWQQLLQALSVLGDAPRAAAALAKGEAAFAADPASADQLRQFADQLGIAP